MPDLMVDSRVRHATVFGGKPRFGRVVRIVDDERAAVKWDDANVSIILLKANLVDVTPEPVKEEPPKETPKPPIEQQEALVAIKRKRSAITFNADGWMAIDWNRPMSEIRKDFVEMFGK